MILLFFNTELNFAHSYIKHVKYKWLHQLDNKI